MVGSKQLSEQEDQYQRYCFIQEQMGVANMTLISKHSFLMHSPARRATEMESLENRYNALQYRADTSYKHYLYLQECIMNSGRVGMSDPYTNRETWEGHTLAFKVEQIANLEKLLDLPSSKWSKDTPRTPTDVVAW